MTELINNRFRLLKKCGSGGSGDVFEALDLRLNRKVALKRVRMDSRADKREKAQRLLKEAENLALVEHPNVVAIHDVLEQEDSVAIVMELVKGIPFSELFRKQALSENEFLGYMRQLVSALEAVHAAEIVHRDVNPRNVLVTLDGLVKLMDFSLSTTIHDPAPRAGGTVGYMAPEALRKGVRLSYGLDIYSLGLLSYQALLGMPAFLRLYGTPKPIAWARWLLSREKFRTLLDLEAPVTPALSAIIEKMLEKDLKQRYQKMKDLRQDIERLGVQLSPRPQAGPSLVAGVRRLLPALLARPSDEER